MSSDEEIGNGEDLMEYGEANEETGLVEEAQEDNNEEAEEEEKKDEAKTTKTKRVVRNPQPKLNEQTLRGPKGLSSLPGHFKRVKFKGRGYEEQDLNVLLKTYEYWCHRLFPKFQFDDCIEKLEKLGAKKGVQAHIRRIRMDIDFDDETQKLPSDNEQEETGVSQIDESQFDGLIASSNKSPEPELTEEQLERIRLNRERAEKLRQERLKKIAENANSNSQPMEKEKSGQENKDQVNSDEDMAKASPSSQKQKRVLSDSEEDEVDELNSISPLKNKECTVDNDMNDDNNLKQISKTSKKKKRVLSESEDEIELTNPMSPDDKKEPHMEIDDDINENEEMEDATKTPKKKKRILSDSDDETEREQGINSETEIEADPKITQLKSKTVEVSLNNKNHNSEDIDEVSNNAQFNDPEDDVDEDFNLQLV